VVVVGDATWCQQSCTERAVGPRSAHFRRGTTIAFAVTRSSMSDDVDEVVDAGRWRFTRA
jgi:hypothetical protein